MKILLLAASLFVTVSAYSMCPNLEGSYHCEMMEKEWTHTITQVANNSGPEKYLIDEDGVIKEIITDGVIHKLANTKDLRRITYQASCENSELSISVFGMYVGLPLKVKLFSTFSMNEDGNLLLLTKGSAGGVPIPLTTTICPRLE